MDVSPGDAHVSRLDCVIMVMTPKRAAAAKAKGGRDSFHRKSMAALQNANVPFLIGGAYVVEAYAGVSRRSKDFDLYVRPHHVDVAMDTLARAGYKTEKTFPHWLAKVGRGRDHIDLIFRAGNGLCEVDDSWFERAHDDKLRGRLELRRRPITRQPLRHLAVACAAETCRAIP